MRKQGIGFRMAVMAGGAVLMLVPALIAGWVYTGALQKEAEALVAAKLKGRGEIGADQIARRLYSLWQTVERFARSANVTAPRDMQGDFTLFMAGRGGRERKGCGFFKRDFGRPRCITATLVPTRLARPIRGRCARFRTVWKGAWPRR
jgi:hypothetical protein